MQASLPKPFSFCLIGDVYEPYVLMANRVMQDLRPFMVPPPSQQQLDQIVWQLYHKTIDSIVNHAHTAPPVFKYPPMEYQMEPDAHEHQRSLARKEYFNYFYHQYRDMVDWVLEDELEVPDDDLSRNRLVTYMTDFTYDILRELERHILQYVEYHIVNDDASLSFSLDPDNLFYRFLEAFHVHHTRPKDLPLVEGEEDNMQFYYEVKGLDIQVYHRWSFSLLYQGHLHLHLQQDT